MSTLRVNLPGREYDIVCKRGVLDEAGTLLRPILRGNLAAIVTDSNVEPLYAQRLAKSLMHQNFKVAILEVPAGEGSKCPEVLFQLWEQLMDVGLTRSDAVIALGGGVVGDLAGFAAATILRGVDFVQVPTTLLAQVDSSVGGKVAVDLEAGKNLAGAFYQPDLVICDIDCLSTLPEDRFIDGCAEVIKYATVFDEALFAQLQAQGRFFSPESVVARCVELKADVVAQDEFDCECRHLLNFGHTVGHAIEKASGYTISHGRAVAIGMAVISRASAAGGLCTPQVCNALDQLLSDFSLPTKTDIPLSLITPHLSSDKKRFDDKIDLILPATIGCAQIANLSFEQLESFIKAGM